MNELKPCWGQYYIDKVTGEIVRYCPLHPGQQAIMDATNARFLFFIGGKGVGKSTFAFLWLLKEIEKRPLGKFIIAADSYNRIEQALLPEFLTHIKQTRFAGTWNQGKHSYQLATGGVVYVRSLDDPESVNGIHASAIVADEGLLLSKAAWDILESRVVQQLGRILVTSTPYKGKRWGLDIIERFKTGEREYFVWQGGSVVNPNVSPAEIERQKRLLPDWKFRQDYLGEFSMPEGTIYPTIRDCVVDPYQLPEGRIYAGIDHGAGGAPSAAIVGVLDRENTLHCFFELYQRPQGQESSYLGFAKALKTWANKFNQATGRVVERWYCDSANDLWKSLRRYRLPADDGPSLNCRPAKKGAGSVEYGIDLLSARIQTGKLKQIRGTTPNLLIESESYRYEIDEDNSSSNKIVGADHALDAIRYLCMSIDRGKQLV